MNTPTPSLLGDASIAALRQYLRAARAQNLPIESLLDEIGLSHALAESNESKISGADFQRVIHALCNLSRSPVFGLETGDYVEPGSYSVLGYITMSCATLGEAIERIAPYEKLVGDMGLTRVRLVDNNIHIIWQCAYTDPTVRPQMVDNIFASWINFGRWLSDTAKVAPIEVRLERRSPAPEYNSAYQQRWQCPVIFDAADNRIIVDRNLLDTPLRQPDPSLRRTLEAHARSQMADMSDDIALLTRVRNAIRRQLLQGVTRQDLIAEQLGMTTRTLQRKLSQEDASYQILLDDVRQASAEDYLINSAISIPEIAHRLGFSETTSFHRRFKARTGITPGEFRSGKRSEND